MATKVHFIDVGQGNMTLLQLDDGKNFLYDCNVTRENEGRILSYLADKIGINAHIDMFICSHRDADHIRGIKKINDFFPIKHVWDSGATGSTPDCNEYLEYMEIRRIVGFTELKSRTRYDFGNTRLRIMNAKNDVFANANAQSIVIKVVQRNSATNTDYDSVLLTGDTDAVTWKYISQKYNKNDLSCSLLLASHHGSLTYFNDPEDKKYYYTSHLEVKSPDMTIISVGSNGHGHPDDVSLKLYEKYSKGSNKGKKIFRTDKHGHLTATLNDRGGWKLKSEKKYV
jgi:beta-lactamase superfamily II metal-dependent hydrolase